MSGLYGHDLPWEPEMHLWPDLDFRKDVLRYLENFILDRDGKYPTARPGTYDPEMPPPLKVQAFFFNCVKQYTDNLLSSLEQRPQTESDNYAIGRFQQQSYPTEDPFSAPAVTNSAYDDLQFEIQDDPGIADPKKPITDLHYQGPTVQDPLYTDPFLSGICPRNVNLADQVISYTQIVSAEKRKESFVEPLCPQGSFPTPQATSRSHDSGPPVPSALGRRQRPTSREGSPSDAPQPNTRRLKTKRSQPSLGTVADSVGQSPGNFRATSRNAGESSRNTSGTKTAKKDYPHVCNKCGERFEFPARLKSHMETVSHAARKYQCTRCGVTFSRQSSLKRHREAQNACKSKSTQSCAGSPPQSISEPGTRGPTFRGAGPSSIISSSVYGGGSASIAGNQSVTSNNHYGRYVTASGLQATSAGGGHLSPVARVPSQHQRSVPVSGDARSPYHHMYIDPQMLDSPFPRD